MYHRNITSTSVHENYGPGDFSESPNIQSHYDPRFYIKKMVASLGFQSQAHVITFFTILVRELENIVHPNHHPKHGTYLCWSAEKKQASQKWKKHKGHGIVSIMIMIIAVVIIIMIIAFIIIIVIIITIIPNIVYRVEDQENNCWKKGKFLNNQQTSLTAAKMQKRAGAADFSRAFKDAKGIEWTAGVPTRL